MSRQIMLGTRLKTNRANLPGPEITGWLASEKYDGYRCYWNGKHMISRSGKRMKCPSWFTSLLPRQHLDGELFAGYGTRTKLAGMTRNPDNIWWRRVRFMVFDSPDNVLPFSKRIGRLRRNIQNRVIKLVNHIKVQSPVLLQEKFKSVISRGGEGLVVRDPQSLYKHGRSRHFRKYLPKGVS